MINNLDKNEIAILSNLLQKTDRLIAEDVGLSILDASTCNDAENIIACASPERKLIFLNFNKIAKFKKLKNSFDYLVLIKGLDYHELSHLLFSDIGEKDIDWLLSKKTNTEYLAKKNILQLLNICDDCRIESLFSAIYPRGKYYFTYAATTILMDKLTNLNNKEEVLFCYLILYGRKFLKQLYSTQLDEARNILIKKYAFSEYFISKSENLLDSFILELSLNRRLEILYDLYKHLCAHISNKQIKQSSDSHSNATGGSRLKTRKRAREAIENIKQDLKQEKKKQFMKEADNNNKEPKNISTFNKILENISAMNEEKIQTNQNLTDEIKNDLENIKSASVRDTLENFNTQSFNPNAKDFLEAEKIKNILRMLKSDLNISIEKYKTHGKIDMQSAMKSSNTQNIKIFAKKTLNRIDKSRLAVSIILDASRSIKPHEFDDEINATWRLTKALEELKNKVEVIEFSVGFRALKTFNSQGDWKRTKSGGTFITDPLKLAIKNLENISRKENINNKFIIIVSDGKFDDNREFEKAVKIAKSKKIKIIWILAKNEYYYRENVKKSVDWFIHLKSLEELSPKFRNIITQIQRNINLNITGGY